MIQAESGMEGLSAMSQMNMQGMLNDLPTMVGHSFLRTRAGSSDAWQGTVKETGLRDVILGAEYNVREEELRIFLASLRSAGCTADVVLFCGRRKPSSQEHTERLALRFGAAIVNYDFAELNQTHGPVGVHRFHLYRRFLEERRGQYARVLHTDVRDVMFQVSG
ncbi:hypothetical protein T484DRAFT_1850329 [Baffinella frigidus]|nr:hypothetical protein T484DRAFT_1850329 [Cryptophyta sp. CCMP2293]